MRECAESFAAVREAVGEVQWRQVLEGYGWAGFPDIRKVLGAKWPGVREKVAKCYSHLDRSPGRRWRKCPANPPAIAIVQSDDSRVFRFPAAADARQFETSVREVVGTTVRLEPATPPP